MTANDIVNYITLLIIVAPVVIQLVRYVGTITHNRNLINLADRALIIVTSLEQLKLVNNADKKSEALRKLATYAKEVGIKLTEDQAEDYIENAVAELRKLQGKLNKEG